MPDILGVISRYWGSAYIARKLIISPGLVFAQQYANESLTHQLLSGRVFELSQRHCLNCVPEQDTLSGPLISTG